MPQLNKEEYWYGYDKRPMGKPNPYYCCVGCGKTDPQINGLIKNHGWGCTEVERYLWPKEEVKDDEDE